MTHSPGPDLRLLEAVASLGEVSPGDLLSLVAALDVDAPRGAGGASRLNNDGSPLQACATASRQGRALRLLADPAAGEPRPERRLARAQAALRRLLAGLPGREAEGAFLRALEESLPDPDALAALRSGAMWIAAGVGPRGGAGAYVSARWGPPAARWPRALAWLGRWTRPSVAEPLGALDRLAEVASVGLETGAGADHLRAKIYFRLRQPRALQTLPVPLFAEPRLQRFLVLALDTFQVRRGGLVFSVSADRQSDRIADGKIDVCAHCTPRSPEGWVALLHALRAAFDLADLGAAEALSQHAAEPAFLGFGVDRTGACRLNLYLKAAGAAAPPG